VVFIGFQFLSGVGVYRYCFGHISDFRKQQDIQNLKLWILFAKLLKIGKKIG